MSTSTPIEPDKESLGGEGGEEGRKDSSDWEQVGAQGTSVSTPIKPDKGSLPSSHVNS